ncbi:SLBB domain-containing protein [Nitrospira sp. Nam74]
MLITLLNWQPTAYGADAMSVPNPDYRLGPNDVIRVQVFGEDDLTVEGKVGGDGTMNFSLLGPIRVGGRTVQEVREEVTARLAEGYLKQPKVTIYIVRYRNFYVSGEVKTPGGYPYEDGLTIEKAISLAGGFTDKAERRAVKVNRVTNGHALTLPLELSQSVRPDDTVIVAPSEKVYVTGEVVRPGSYLYEAGISLQKAITLAGGFTEKAERNHLTVLRHANGGEEAVPVTPESVMLPDDMIVVPEGQRFYMTGEVKTPGRYRYEPHLTINKAISLAGGVTEKAEEGAVKLTRLTDGHAQTIQAGLDVSILPDDIIAVEPQTHRFYASGEVKTPGGYPYKQGLSVHKALAMAGGMTEKAARETINVLRRTNGQENTFPVRLDSAVLPDDIIVVPEGQRFYVSGEVKNPGHYFYQKDLTIHKAISMAGGVTEKAELGTIKVTRLTDGQAKTFQGDPDSFVLPEDVIVIEPQVHKFYTSGEVKTPGGYPYKQGLTVHKALAMAGGLTDKAERGAMAILRHTNGQEESLPAKLDSLVMPDDIIVVPEGQRFYISGEVKTPGRYLYETNLSVNKAISMAGGVTEKAENSAVKLTRLTGGEAKTMQAAPDALVLPDDIIVVEPQTNKFYVSGEVKTPGGHPFKEGLNVQKAIAMAGGTTEKADRDSVRIVRVINGREESTNVTLNAAVRADDTIVVPEGRRFYVSGEVKTAGRYLYEQGVTVQKAITMAGGFTEKADKAGMAVVRVNGNTLHTMAVELDALILPEDLIVVAQIQKVYVNGEVKTPGGYAYEKGLTIHKAVTMAGGFTDKAAEGRIKVLRRVNGQEQSFKVKLEDSVLPEDIIVVPQSFF